MPKDKPLTLEDLGNSSLSRISSAASYVPMSTIPARPISSSASLLVDPSYVGSVSTRKIQAVKRDHSQSFAATSSSAGGPLAPRPSTDFSLGQSPAKRAKVASFVPADPEVNDNTRSLRLFGGSTTQDISDLEDDSQDMQDDQDQDKTDEEAVGPKRISLLVDIQKDASIYISSSRAAPFLFGPRGVTALVRSPDPERAPDGTIGYINTNLRCIVTIGHPAALSTKTMSDTANDSTDILSVLQRALVSTQPATPFSPKSGIALRTITKLNRFSFCQAASFLPVASPARTLLDLLGVMFDPSLDATLSSLDSMSIGSDASDDADPPLLPKALVDLKSKAHLQKWLATYLAPTATAAANTHLAQGPSSPLHAIRLLVESRQLGAACAMAMRTGYPRLALVLSSAPADPQRAQAHVRDVMQRTGTDPDYKRIVQLVALAPVDPAATADTAGALPEWAHEALTGLSVSQALAHLLAAYPLLKVPEVVRRLAQFEHVLAQAQPASIDEVVMEVVMVATLPEQAGDYVRGLVKATLNKLKQADGDDAHEVTELVGLTVALVGLVAHGVQVHPGDYSKVLVRTAAKLEQVGKWHMAALILQVLALAPGLEEVGGPEGQQQVAAQRNRALLSLIARNVAGGGGGKSADRFETVAAGSGKQAALHLLTKEEQFVVQVLNVPVELVLEAKAMAIATHAASSAYAAGVHKLPIPPLSALGATSNRQVGHDLFPSLGTNAAAAKIHIAHRPVRCKSQAERALEHARVLELVTAANPFAYSSGSLQLAQTAVRHLIHHYVLEDKMQAAVDALAKFEALVDRARRLGMWVASVESVWPAAVSAVVWYREVLAAGEVSRASRGGRSAAGNEVEAAMRRKAEQVVDALSQMAAQRGDEWDDIESTAIFALITKLAAQYGVGHPLRIRVLNLSLDV
ncbi:hypothetical protein BCR44DRAFT_1103465 [Catenaria anguillulae PL171]|uniref:Uncharacterized protein n=1 Tax=Catenaria anguillulae PL171 TaxID=765915 RepID=A0A1Y2I2K3_9FUNG|nr:hypothetical protein BCR44DRAFT_1103465 [Catenaria anguillulae PL171]